LWSVQGIQKVMEERENFTSRTVFETVLFWCLYRIYKVLR